MSARQYVKARVEGGVLRVTIDRPEKRNALSRQVLGELRSAFEAHAGDESLRLAVLSAAGGKHFAAGGDLKELNAVRTLEEIAVVSDEAHAALDSVRRFPVPVVAAVSGDALGGGSELTVACDIRVLAPHARIGFIQGRLNLTTAWGGGTDLMRLLGFGRALSVLSRAEPIGGAEALMLGLADAVAPEGEDFEQFVERFIEPMRRQSPLVMRGFKAQALAERLGMPQTERRRLEAHYFSRSWVHDDHWAVAEKLLTNSK